MIPTWKADKFDPDHLIELYRKAGARYFCSMGIHHDGFDLWKSTYQPRWNAVATVLRRTLSDSGRKAAQKQGLKFAVSEHLAPSYHWFSTSHTSDRTGPLAGVTYDGSDPAYADLYHDLPKDYPYGQRVNDRMAPDPWKLHYFKRIKDLVDNYQPDALYTDGDIFFEEYGLVLVWNLYNTSAKLHGGQASGRLRNRHLRFGLGARRRGEGRLLRGRSLRMQLYSERITAMRIRLVPFLISALPLLTWAADDCNGAPPYDCAVALLQKGRFPAAIDVLEKLTAESPRNLKALNLLGIALSRTGDIEKANARFRQALQADPSFLSALENLSINEFVMGQKDQAKADLETILKENPDDEVAHVYLGEIAFGVQQYGEAIGHYQKARAKVYPVILHYAECLLATGRKNEFSAVLRAIPAEDTEKQFQAGVLLGKAEAHLEAAQSFGRARVHANDPYTAGYDQTLMLIRGGDYAGAIQLSDELFSAGLRHAELYNLVSEAYVKAGQVEKAYRALQTATELEPEAEDNYVDLAGICLDNNNFELGLRTVDIGLKHLPNSYRLHMHRGLLMAHQGLTQEAEKEFETASSLSPSASLPYVALGLAWMQSGDTAKAVEVLRARVRLNSNDFILPYILGIALSRSGAEPDEAKTAFEAAVRLNPRFSPARAQLGKLLLHSEDLSGAIEQLETAVKLDPEDATAAYQLGMAYRRKGDVARAQEMLARVVKLRHQKDEIDPKDEMQRLIRQGAASGDHPVAK